MKISILEGSTPIEMDIINDLIPHLHTHVELNEFEALNIAEAIKWSHRSRKIRKELLSVGGLNLLHKKMFGKTWRWAGQFRHIDTNIGVPHFSIPSDLGNLCENVKYWMENKTYSLDECATRFHHKLVAIHPYPNGNGRHARLATDLLLEFNNAEHFTWGHEDLENLGNARVEYLASLKEADKGKYERLLKFVRS